jgi:hypothetical protein
MKTLISGLNITSYQGLLKTALNKTERQTTQTLLREEEIWLKQHTLKGGSRVQALVGSADHDSGTRFATDRVGVKLATSSFSPFSND